MKIIRTFLFLVGVILCFYPVIFRFVEEQKQENIIATYENITFSYDTEQKQTMFKAAKEYNDTLFQLDQTMISFEQSGTLSEKNYNMLLNPLGTGLIGSVEIPKISMKLPIYHGTEEDVLSIGIGHMRESSLPIGGKNTRVVLTGHRGVPGSKLFTRLDELKKEDLFYIRILDEVFAYEIIEIQVIEPDDVDELKIVPDKDLVTLLTCTPYGINTHRLLVTGERIDFEIEQYETAEPKMMSVRELIFTTIPFLFVGYGIISIIRNKKKRGTKNEYKEN